MDRIHQSLHMSYRRIRKDAVAQIKNVSGTPRGLVQDPFGVAAYFRDLGEKDYGIQIPLYGHIPEPLPGRIEFHPPIDANDLAPRFLHQVQKHGRLRSEMNDRSPRADPLNDTPAVRQHISSIIFRG